MLHDMPWGPSPACGRYTYWPHDDRWELSEGAYAILGIPTGTPVTTALIMSHQHPDDVTRTKILLASLDTADDAGYSYPHRVVDGNGLVHEVVAVGLSTADDRGARTEGFLVDLSEVGGHPARSAPMVPVEFDPVDLVIRPCRHCAQWWAEVVVVGDLPLLREWHEPYCPEALRWAVSDGPVLARGHS